MAGGGVLALSRRATATTSHPPVDLNAAGAWLLGLGLVGYLGLRGGGYDDVVRGEAGIVAWWLIVVAAGFGVLAPRLGWRALVGVGLLAAFAGWTALSLTWTQGTEQTVGEVSRMGAYVGFLALALLLAGRSAGRHAVDAVGCAVALVAVVALLTRLRFAWFAPPDVATFLPGSTRKLSVPLNYWNALAALMAMGVPALLHTATGARRLALRALAAGVIPLLALATSLTLSRGGAVAVAAGVAVFLVLTPDRLPKLATVLVCAAGSAALILAASQRSAVRDGLRTALAQRQGDQLLVICLAVVAGVALLSAAVALVDRHARRPAWMVLTKRTASRATLAGVAAGATIFLLAGGGGLLHREWQQFKSPGSPASVSQTSAVSRLGSLSSHGRYQYWQVAARAEATRPLTGIGAGNFANWWAQHATVSGFVHDAHSLYLQAFAELGAVGLGLIASFLLFALGCGVTTCARAVTPERRLAVAAASAGLVAFAVSAAVEWIWFIAVLPVALFVFVAVILGDDAPSPARSRRPVPRWRGPATRAGVCGAGLAAIVVIAVSVTATSEVRSSQALDRQGQLGPALARAREAASLEPYAATPRTQEALILEQEGNIAGALAPAKLATQADPNNWRPWLVLSRLEARAGDARASVVAFRRGRSLDPRSPIFAG